MTTSSNTDQLGTMPFLNTAQVEAAVTLQKELLEAYEQASRGWLARVQSEVALWAELGSKWQPHGPFRKPSGLASLYRSR